MSTTALPIPAPYAALVDDAAIFPPGDAPLPDAVAAHDGHRSATYAALVGAFVVSDVRLPDLIALRQAREPAAESDGPAPLPVSVVVTGGAGAIEPAVRWAASGELDLRGVEIALRDEEDLAHNARRIVTALDQLYADGHLAEQTTVYLEPPPLLGPQPPHSWLAALDEIAAADLRLKFRTGGVSADAFPDEHELGTCIDAALDRELPFKCTAGLHHAVRHTVTTGFERPVAQHGFLNVLLATRASLSSAGSEQVREVLDERAPEALVAQLREAGDEALAAARLWFTSFGSCSVDEPLEDLRELGLLPELPKES